MNTRVPLRHHRLRLRPLAACFATMLVAAQLPATAATLPVTSCLDDGSPGSLRAVVNSAIDGDIVDLTTLTCSTITLTQGPIDTEFLAPHPLDEITIQGPGRDALTISGGGQSLVFSVGGYSGYSVFTLNDVTVADGINTGSLWSESPACIDGVRGTVVLNRVTITDCHSIFVGGFSGGGAVGVSNLQMTDSLISDSSVDAVGGNTAQGGGAWVGGRMVLVRSKVTGNRVSALVALDGYGGPAATGGGGVYSANDLFLTDSTISGNTVEATNPGENGRGGGALARATMTVVGSAIEDNTADGDGGGLYKLVSQLVHDQTYVAIRNSTLSGNSAGGAGGGFASQRKAALVNSTVAFNHAALGGAVMFRLTGIDYSPPISVLTLQSSIIAGNTADAGAPYAPDLGVDGQLIVDGANNLVVAADSAIVLPADTLAADPLLLPLADNGGPTRTHALGLGSPAIDAGNNAAALAFDQRGEGFPRLVGAAADIGAFEVQPVVDAIFADGFDP